MADRTQVAIRSEQWLRIASSLDTSPDAEVRQLAHTIREVVTDLVAGALLDADAPRARSPLAPHSITVEQRARMVALRAEGRSLLDIAISTGTTPQTVKHHLRADAEAKESEATS